MPANPQARPPPSGDREHQHAIAGSALYLNTTRAEDLDGDGEARFDEAGTGFQEITDLPFGIASASSPQVVGGDPSRDRRYPFGLKPQLNASFSLISDSDNDGFTYRLLQAGWHRGVDVLSAEPLSFEAWVYDLQAEVDANANDRVDDVKTSLARSLNLHLPEDNPPGATTCRSRQCGAM